jgi:hypothetical protein
VVHTVYFKYQLCYIKAFDVYDDVVWNRISRESYYQRSFLPVACIQRFLIARTSHLLIVRDEVAGVVAIVNLQKSSILSKQRLYNVQNSGCQLHSHVGQ